MSQVFDAGKLYITAGIQELVVDGKCDVTPAFNRHLKGDWGELCDDDRQSNADALIHGERLLSAYTVNGIKIWIITEADRSVTTILLPSEY